MRPPLLLTRSCTVVNPRPVPLSGVFVVKNASNRCSCVSASIPMPLSLTEKYGARQGRRGGLTRMRLNRKFLGACRKMFGHDLYAAVCGFNADTPAVGDGVARIEHQVEQNLLRLFRQHPYRSQFRIENELQISARSHQPNEQVPHPLKDGVQRDCVRRRFTGPRGREQLPHKLPGLDPGRPNLFDIPAQARPISISAKSRSE